MIRKYTKDDLESIMSLWLAGNMSVHDFIDKAYWMSHYEMVKQMMPEATLYVYEEGGTIQGFIGLMEDYIAGVFVAQEMRSKGIGKQLLDYAKARHTHLQLQVYKKNIRAICFYQREEFMMTTEQIDENTGEAEWVMSWEKR